MPSGSGGFFSYVAGGAVSAGEHGITGGIGKAVEAVTNRVAPITLPEIPEIIHAMRTDKLSWELGGDLLKQHGVTFFPRTKDPPKNPVDLYYWQCAVAWQAVFWSHESQPGLGELHDLINRGLWTVSQANQALIMSGFQRKEVRDSLLQLRYEIPGAGELTRFAVRHVWEPDLIAYFGYDDEYRPAMEYWLGQQGFSYDARTPEEKAKGREPYTWGKAEWWAHWILPSPGQGYEMVQRLRKTGGPNGKPRDPSGQIFTPDDLALLLRANDYPPFWREKLAAIAYRPIGLRQLQQMYRVGITDRAELVEQWQDLGFHPKTAEKQAELVIRQERQRRYTQEIQGAKGRILRSYETGTIGKDEAAVQLYTLTLPDPDQAVAFNNLPFDQRQQTAWAEPGVRAAINSIDYDVAAKTVGKAITTIRRLFLSGRISYFEMRSRLNTLGIVRERIDSYSQTWNLENHPIRKEATAGQILMSYRHLLLTEPQAAARLSNLGYGMPDIQLLLAEADRSISLDAAKQEAAAARTVQQRLKAQEAVARAALAEHNRARSELARHGSPGQLKTWLIKGLIDPTSMRRRLLQLDWPAADADREVADATELRAQRLKTQADRRERERVKAHKQAREAAAGIVDGRPPTPIGPSLATLKSWLKKGIIDSARVQEWMDTEQWSQEDQDAFLTENAPPG